MTAEEMFKELDGVFNVEIEKEWVTGYGAYYNYTIILKFVDSEKRFFFHGFDNSYHSDGKICPEEHLAIHKFLEELGWLRTNEDFYNEEFYK